MVSCHRCGYEWDYSGELKMATCPSCTAKTPVEDSETESTERKPSRSEQTCHKCGYEWDYSGEMNMASCPSCKVKTPVEDSGQEPTL